MPWPFHQSSTPDKHDNEGIVDAAYDENMEQPLIHRFKKYSEKIKDLEEKTGSSERIQQNAEAATGASVEEIAMQSELMETTKELGVLNKTLSQIDSIPKKTATPLHSWL